MFADYCHVKVIGFYLYSDISAPSVTYQCSAAEAYIFQAVSN